MVEITTHIVAWKLGNIHHEIIISLESEFISIHFHKGLASLLWMDCVIFLGSLPSGQIKNKKEKEWVY